jgi:DNA-binding NtrC family response regulator
MVNNSENKKVLIIDDESNIIELLSFFIRKAGFTPVGFTDGYEALKEFANSDFAFVITDMHMPRINGFDLLSQLHQIKKDVPVAVVTGYSDFSDKELKDNGAVAIFSKPINYPLVTKTIEDNV